MMTVSSEDQLLPGKRDKLIRCELKEKTHRNLIHSAFTFASIWRKASTALSLGACSCTSDALVTVFGSEWGSVVKTHLVQDDCSRIGL